VRSLDTPRDGSSRIPRRPTPGSRQAVVARPTPPPPLKKPTAVPPRKAAEPAVAKPIARLTPEQLEQARNKQHLKPEDLLRPQTPVAEVAPTADVGEDEDDKKGGKKKSGPGGVVGRDKRRQDRDKRAADRKKRAEGGAVGGRGGAVILADEEDSPRHRKLHKLKKQRPQLKERPRGKVAIQLPITVRSLSETIGIKSGELLFKLMNQGITPVPNINSTLDLHVAELLALDYGIELEAKRAPDAEEHLLSEADQPDEPEALEPRAPIVTIMGHVDHGKTSLLDRIRRSNVVATEAGGITQVIRAWRVEHHGKPITFLDTPGHEAFTKMRARGAQVTDIAVIVVAAEDGVMPQTEEAISHAKAAGVSLVVAINKVDLPNANVNKTRQQLYGLNVLPDNMGGDTPFVETSAATGKGIDELLEAISLVAELKELKANPHRPARGTCLEAMLSEGEGVLATLLVQQGTLHRGDVILCGATYGRVRQMYDDQGRPLQEAGPSVPVRVTGLDEIPDADDPFLAAPDLQVAREIATKRKAKRLETALTRRAPLTLEQLTETKIAELKVILKADFRGSIEAIRKELEKLKHEEVRVRILEAAIGGITENDVWLALTSPQDTLIVGFNVVPDDRARALAEEKGVKILQYDIIYNLTKDIRAALEGKLKPREEVVHLGRAVVRETFKISRVGTIAGCSVTQGTIERSAKVRLIREGLVIYPPPDRTAGLESLKRFRDDVREVREGFECGIKIAGYDDVKVGDVIEAYRVEEVKRTL
jgi:translation initiation factor IF-2